MVVIFLSHDVDWPRKGPGKQHILDRSNRFDEETIHRVLHDEYNPYYGIAHLMEVEERQRVRSTFFFRPVYDDGSILLQYEPDLKELVSGGWEIGAHLNDVSTRESVISQKEAIENITHRKISGSRVHYLRISPEQFANVRDGGFLYDSSLVFAKDRLDLKNTGYTKLGGMTVFPITFMDTYLFSNFGLDETNLVNYILECVKSLSSQGVELITLLWHDNSVNMKGGRLYDELLEELIHLNEISILTGKQCYKYVNGK